MRLYGIVLMRASAPHRFASGARLRLGDGFGAQLVARRSFSDGRDYSITSSARASSVSGTVRPSALAVFMLMTSLKRVGFCTGRSAGLVPLRIGSTYSVARRN